MTDSYYEITHHTGDGPVDPPHEGWVADDIVERHRGVTILWVDAEYLREQTTGSVEVSVDASGKLERVTPETARQLADLVGNEAEVQE